jgi:hypothetical protein
LIVKVIELFYCVPDFVGQSNNSLNVEIGNGKQWMLRAGIFDIDRLSPKNDICGVAGQKLTQLHHLSAQSCGFRLQGG